MSDADQSLVIRPGETLLLRYEQQITAQQADEVKRRVGELLPEVDVVIFGGVAEMGVYRPEAAA